MSTPESLDVTRNGPDLPATDVLTGRGFVTGKSGSGKSNTASVIAEELLAADLPLLVVDTDGEYYGLRESYDLLHVGAGRRVDAEIGPEHAERLADLALGQHVPVVLDVSGYRDPDRARETVGSVVAALFAAAYDHRRPFLLLVEEVHEYLPQSGGRDAVGDALLRVAKRGRKRGLGLCGLSQRPAAVDKDYLTQCDWLVWHRLTWNNDTEVVRRFLGPDAAGTVSDLDDGEALLAADWNDGVERVQVRRKHTFDAGATPDLDGSERPELRAADADLVAELASLDGSDDASHESGVGEGDEADAELASARERIAELEARLDGEKSAETADTAASGNGEVPADEHDPLWEVGQLTAHLVRAGGASLLRGGRRLAGGVGRAGRRASRAARGTREEPLDGRFTPGDSREQ